LFYVVFIRKNVIMELIQPKPYLNRLRLRNHAFGEERRRNMSKIILERGTPFPLPITYEDIDQTFFNWVEKELSLSYNGKEIPTYRLFSNQRINEYSQTWENLDETGNIVMNFKTITRENNPQHGESQGGSYNIPGHKDFAMFYVPVLQENGEEAYDLYSMKQPFAVNFVYTLNFVCNKYELLNRFNEKINYEFSGLECYIFPNGHSMPMTLDSISDESEYSIDDRKFYSQTYTIKLMGYIIRKEDFKVTHLPSRMIVRFLDVYDGDGKKIPSKRDSRYDLGSDYGKITDIEMYGNVDVCDVKEISDINNGRPNVVLKEDEIPDSCCYEEDSDDSHYYNKKLTVLITIPNCEKELTFTMDTDMVVTSIETENIYDFLMFLNEEKVDFDKDVKIYDGDEVKIKLSFDDEYKGGTMTIIGYDPNVVLDDRNNPESELDADVSEEIIEIGG